MSKEMTALGLMSGTSMDGVDLAIIRTDGEAHITPLAAHMVPYPDDIRAALRPCLGLFDDPDGRIKQAETMVTRFQADLVKTFLVTHPHSVDVIGFHGQTIFHDPDNRRTKQLGDGAAMAAATGIGVVYDFRQADVQAGGQGAPFLPLYHRALCLQAGLPLPCAILNLGGVGNVTLIGPDGDTDIVAFDTGPASALIDDWVLRHTGAPFDKDGSLARSGTPDKARLAQWLSHPFFGALPPKSLDRNAFHGFTADGLSAADGAATYTAFTVETVARGLQHWLKTPRALYVTGGGRHNRFMMEQLEKVTGLPTHSVDSLGWRGDVMEAEGFAYLAVRSLKGLPLSVPGTTGVPTPQTGGVYAAPPPKR